ADGNLLEPQDNNFLCAVCEDNAGVGLASIDLSTGDFRITEFLGLSSQDLLQTELERLQPKEVLYPSKLNSKEQPWAHNPALVRTAVEDWTFAQDYVQRLLSEHFGVMSLDGFGCHAKKLAVAAAGAVLHYVKETQKASLGHIDQL